MNFHLMNRFVRSSGSFGEMVKYMKIYCMFLYRFYVEEHNQRERMTQTCEFRMNFPLFWENIFPFQMKKALFII